MKRYITAILPIAAVLILLGTCGDQNRKVIIRYPHDAAYMNIFKQDGSQKVQVWQEDSLVYSFTRLISFDISQRVLRILPDSTAAVEEKSSMTVIVPNRKDTSVIDTIREDRSFVLYEAPNGRIVDFESNTPMDSGSSAHFRSWYEQACPVFPDTAVGIGSTWEISNRVNIDGQTLHTSTKFTVRSLEQLRGYDCIVMDFSGNIILPVHVAKDDTMLIGGRDEIRVTGSFWFAYKEGLFVEQTQKEVTEGRRDMRHEGKEITRKYLIEGNVRMYLTERKRI